MPSITVISRDGVSQSIDISTGMSVMEAIRDAGVDELMALCGGCCSCATCHIYVEEGGQSLGPISADEDDLLDSSDHRDDRSRLSCQLVFDAAMPALTVRVAPEE